MYQSLVRGLICLARTRLDTVHSMSVISQYMHEQKKSLQATYRILHYLKGNPWKGILFKRNGRQNLEASTDVDHASSLIDRRSTAAYCTFLDENLHGEAKNKMWLQDQPWN